MKRQESSRELERRVRAAVDADQLGRDALADLRLVARLGQDDQAGVGVEVDEARARRRGRSHRCRAPPRDRTDVAAQDAHGLALHADGTVEADVAGAVDDLAVFDEQVEHAGAPREFRPRV